MGKLGKVDMLLAALLKNENDIKNLLSI